jgi:hypothetical protein
MPPPHTQHASSNSLTRNLAGQITHKAETVAGATANYDYTFDPMGACSPSPRKQRGTMSGSGLTIPDSVPFKKK